jgi:hypothetical protein
LGVELEEFAGSLSGRAPVASAHGNPSGSFEFGFAEHPRSHWVFAVKLGRQLRGFLASSADVDAP